MLDATRVERVVVVSDVVVDVNFVPTESAMCYAWMSVVWLLLVVLNLCYVSALLWCWLAY